jgi:hypothetical protein
MNRYAFLAALMLVVLCASPAAASDFGRYWSQFRSFWAGLFGSVSGVVGVALVTGIVGIFIITRGKWVK